MKVVNPRVICGFPGIGKSTLSNKHYLDSDSSNFSKTPDGKPHPDWPQNYIDHIKNSKAPYYLASSHLDVRKALAENNIPYIVAVPDLTCKQEYLKRYIDRKSPPAFVKLLDGNWHEWVSSCLNDRNATQIVVLRSGQYLSDVI